MPYTITIRGTEISICKQHQPSVIHVPYRRRYISLIETYCKANALQRVGKLPKFDSKLNLLQSKQPATRKTIKIVITIQNTIHGYNLMQTSISKQHLPTPTAVSQVPYCTERRYGPVYFFFFSKLNLLQNKQPATSRKTIKILKTKKIPYTVTI
jgi:hypothetical protein